MSEPIPENLAPAIPASIGGYEILWELKKAESFTAAAPGGRVVVLKVLDPDCLVRTGAGVKLHPSIRDRLSRVRELAHARVANLHGVERDGPWVYLVWEYVAGRTLEEWSADPSTSSRDMVLVARNLILTVEALHARGIVHGAIHARNVILDQTGLLKLTHVSPLLYSEPAQDMAAIGEMFRALFIARGEPDSPLAQAVDMHAAGASQGSFASRISSLIDPRTEVAADDVEVDDDRRRRIKSRIGAFLVVLVALVFSYGLRLVANQLSGKPPMPPEASAIALQP